MTGRFVGIDVGARTLHCAAVGERGGLVERAALPALDRRALADWCDGAAVIAIDAPETPSRAPHRNRAELSPKFRTARCAEIELGRRHGTWVPWVPPQGPPFPGWMQAGFDAFDSLRRPGAPDVIEVYPFAGFRILAGGRRLAKKQTAAGRAERAALLARAGVTGAAVGDHSHDELDALLAAVVARDHARDAATAATCGHDGSAIWLPDRPAQPPPF
jgi:predicted nuclease with RNAse H fold